MRNVRWLLAVLAVAVAPGVLAAQQTGTIQGVVTDLENAPVSGAQVSVAGTGLGTLTDAQGRFQVLNVPAGSHQLRLERIGFGAVTRDVTVTAGQVTTLNVRMEQEAVGLAGIVVTGMAEATPRAKLPITVDQLTSEDLPVPQVSAAGAIQGKVAGAQVVSGSGRPGSAPTILLRAPTSINASGRNQDPLYIVDGVILSSSVVDIDALDIESIEVVKGASAASLYGSRAAAGAIQITTRRGSAIQDDRVRYTIRSEIGGSSLPGEFNLTQRHGFAMTPDGTMFVSAAGNPCNWLECPSVGLAGQNRLQAYDADGNPRFDEGGSPILRGASNWNTVHRESWPGTTYNHVDDFFTGGRFMQNYVSAEGRSGATNYHVSYSNLEDEGVMPGHEGFSRHNFRLNLDQSVLPSITLSGSAFYSRSTQNAFPEGQGNPIFRLTRMPAGVNLRACVDDPSGDCTGPDDRLTRLIIEPDPFNENDNPLYELLNRQYQVDRGRFLGSANVRWTPINWFNLDGNVSYDRLDYRDENVYPKGYRDIRNTVSLREGSISRYHQLTEGLNASVRGTFRTQLGDIGTARTVLQYLWEQDDVEWTDASGYNFAVAQIHNLSNVEQTNVTAGSGIQPVRSDGYFLNTYVDLMDRYIVDALIRNDGSSLFGPDERRQWYYRLAAAWRITEEPWLDIPALNELKLRYSVGTAGGRPSWAAQYETYSVSAGRVSPVTLGNRELRPEFSTEHEVGVEAVFLDRFDLGVVYATTTTENQILNIPLAPYFGFGSQWRNAGTLESNTWEASLNARIITTPTFNWSARVLFDRTRQEITELDRPAYRYGVAGQAMGDVFYARVGESIGTFYGAQAARSCDQLPSSIRDRCGEFAVNDEGYLVWVGSAGSTNAGWQQYNDAGGVPQTWWGTSSGMASAGRSILWGTPFQGVCQDAVTGEETTFCPVGNTTPDYSISLSNTMNWRGLSVYALFDAVQGFDVYNQPLQWATFQNYAGVMDQSRVPEDQQKPVGYYLDGLYGGLGGLAPADAWVHDGSFVKLREMSLRYRIDGATLAGVPGLNMFDALTLSAIGRNLITWTDYDGYDPEVGRGGGTVGSAALARVDGFNYPNFRTFTFGLEFNF
jgi:TonB-linked SusC/RagA family outer membrane protein